MRVGLSSYGDIPTGLGQLAARFARKLPLAGWLIAPHRLGCGTLTMRFSAVCHRPDPRWLDTVDTVLLLERPVPDGILPAAKAAGKRVVLVVMPEWLPASTSWLGDVDRFVCFTRQGEAHCRAIGVGARTVRVQCPLDLAEFPFRERTRVKDVVFCNGWGGVGDRKGWPEVREMLREAPGLVRVKSQRPGLPGAEGPAPTSAALYADADAVLVPGRFDGLGLTTLEAMASGCVVLATDAEPYREFVAAAYGYFGDGRRPWRHLFPADEARASTVSLGGGPWPCRPASVAGMRWAVEDARRMDADLVAEFSHAGREYVEREHGEAAWTKLWEVITGCAEAM